MEKHWELALARAAVLTSGWELALARAAVLTSGGPGPEALVLSSGLLPGLILTHLP